MSDPMSLSAHGGSDSSMHLIRRLLAEYGFAQWKRYAIAFSLMGLGAICTGLSAYLMGNMINEAYDQIANERENLAEQFNTAWRRHPGAE